MRATKWMKSKKVICELTLVLFFFLSFSTHCFGFTPAGYSEYYIPGDESDMEFILNALDLGMAASPKQPMHSVITVTAWSANTIVYYDHWEYGYEFDPANPDASIVANGGHVEKYALATAGAQQVFESSNIPTNPRGTGQYYDGGDRIYVAGGAVTVTRASWIEATGVGNQAVAWEIYPVKPQLTTYVLPFGENLGATLPDFSRVFVLIQATADNTVVTIDRTGDGTADMLDLNRDGTCGNAGDATTVTLNRGQTFLLDRVSNCGAVNTGVVITGTETLQVKYVAGEEMNPTGWMARGFSVFPRGYWTKDYYAPMDNQGGNSDYYLYNPNTSEITVTWETMSSSGSFTIPAGQTVSYRNVAGAVPSGSGIYFKGSDVFWGVGSADAGSYIYEWGYSLLPSTMMYNEHYLGWAQDCDPVSAGCTDNGVFLIPAQDNTTIFVDTNNDGVPDQTYTLNRLQTQYITAPSGDLSRAHIWATGLFSMAYGQHGGIDMQAPAMDLGYVAIPASDFVSLVLNVSKSVSPQVVPTALGSVATFTIKVDSHKYTVDGVTVTDYLPPNWNYVIGTDSTTIIRPDKTSITGAAADPTESGTGPYTLSWSSAQLGTNGTPGMAENQEITITFTARTTAVLATGTLSQNRVQAVGTRTFGTPTQTQTFTAADFVYVVSGDLTLTKTSSATDPVYPGDQITYTVTVTNPSASAYTGISIYDPLPLGTSYVASSAQVTGTKAAYYLDRFGARVYTNQDGGLIWNTNWIEENDGGSPTGGNIRIVQDGTFPAYGLRFNLGNNNRRIARRADLSGYASAVLSFDYRRAGTNAGDAVAVQVCQNSVGGNPITCNDAGGLWTTVATIGGAATDANYVTASYNLAANFLSANFAVRLAYASTGGTGNRNIWFDNIKVTGYASGSFSALAPPEMVKDLDGYYIAAGQSLILTYSVSVDNPLASGISSITNTAYVNNDQITLPLSASVTNIVVNPSSASAEVGDRVWLDANGNGVVDIGEPGLANVEVTLRDQFGTPVMTTVTDATGHYLFTGVEAGNGFYVEVTASSLPAGLQQSAPAGHSDNRTGTFNLVAGQSYRDANLGFRSVAGKATIGNYVWTDANADNRRNPGETGLADITVQLYRDVNGNGTLEIGTDILCDVAGCGANGTTTTAPDGSYLFTGVTASGTEDYIVYVDEAQGGLSGYTRTSPPSGSALYSIINIASGASILYANFGYQGTTYSISDYVWFDASNYGVKDSGEPGIAGVTVDLLDSSLNVIATTTTASDGSFIFTGVKGGGADYTIRITDTDGKLTDYFGTTDYARAGLRQVANLTTDMTFASFGYNLARAIGGTVFNDSGAGGGTSGDGIQNGSEPGISGVTVLLYRDDGNGTFEPGGADGSPIGEAVTDSAGRYIFSGLSNGTYWVHIDNTQSALNGYGLTSADDSGVAGHQRRVTMSGSTNIGIDYGYRATASGSVSGTVWEDNNKDGIIDGGELGVAGVTIVLLSGSNVVSSVTTDSYGNYSFIGIPGGAYTVKITDDNGVLAGYSPTYQVTGGTSGPFTGEEGVNLGDLTGIDFGYYNPIPTQVILSRFGAFEKNGRVIIKWETATEIDTLGFNLLRLDPVTGEYRRVNSGLLPAMLKHRRGGKYAIKDAEALPGRTYTYKLIEVEVGGKELSYGPFTVIADKKSDDKSHEIEIPGDSGYNRAERDKPDQHMARMASRNSKRLMREHAVIGDRLRISVTDSGIYYVDAKDIAAIMDMSSDKASSMIIRGRLSLSNQGRPVSYLPERDGAGLYFYGTGAESVYTKENIYWIDGGTGSLMTVLKGAGPLPTPEGNSFTETMHLEEDAVFWESLFNDPNADYWFWSQIFASEFYTDPPASFAFRPIGLGSEPTAVVRINLLGGSDSGVSDDHHVVVSLNGQSVEDHWSGITPHFITSVFPLLPGENTITVTGKADAGVPSSLVLIDSFDVTYQRLYEADGDSLSFRGRGFPTITVGGFSSSDIKVFDLTDPLMPKLHAATTIGTSGTSGYSVSLNPLSADTPYLAVASGGIKPASLRAVVSSHLSSKNNAADYIVIAPASLVSTAQSLADYRSSRGMKTMVVKLEDIMNEFNYGIYSPEAIRKFLLQAYSKWKKAPRYVVLAGDGSMDYKNNLKFGGSLIPSRMVPTGYGLAASDNYLADVNGDHLPEMAIGRLPVVNAEELQAVINKIRTYERNLGNTVAVVVADTPDSGGDFITGSEAVAGLFPSGYTVKKIYLDDPSSVDAKRLALISALNQGAAFFNYVGHAGPEQLSNSGLLSHYPYPEYDPPADDLPLLMNGATLPVMTAMTCGLVNFADPYQDVLGEALLLKADGGVAAVWSATGLSDDVQAGILDREFYKAVFSGNKAVLGDAVLQAISAYNKQGTMPFMMDTYCILGDPALRIR